ncbi:hypothetical protein BSKO_10379 [Bryopsis sp. KO-2023]|nr:hypothetical protein BSKO_10379 [Bryopsis sp. KO-2023]
MQRWKEAASTLLTAGNVLLVDADSLLLESASVQQAGQPPKTSLKAIHAEMHTLHNEWRDVDVEYCKALEDLEVERQHVRGFHFRRQRVELNWKLVHSVNVEGLMGRNDASELDRVMEPVMHGCLNWEEVESLEEQNFKQLIRVTQCCLQYKMHQLNAAHGDVAKMETAFDKESTTVSCLYTRIEELWTYFLILEEPPVEDVLPDVEVEHHSTVPPELLEDIEAERKAISELRDTLSLMKTKIDDMGAFQTRMTQQAATSPRNTISVSRNSNVKQFVKQERLLGQTELRVQIEELKQRALDHFLTRYDAPPTFTTDTISIQVKPPHSKSDD